MFGLDELYSTLNVSTVTNLLDSYGTGKALFNEIVAPEGFTGDDYITFYLDSPYNGALEYGLSRITINCFSGTYNNSISMANTVFNLINRKHITDGFITCQLLKTIPPIETTDLFNTPVSINLKMR